MLSSPGAGQGSRCPCWGPGALSGLLKSCPCPGLSLVLLGMSSVSSPRAMRGVGPTLPTKPGFGNPCCKVIFFSTPPCLAPEGLRGWAGLCLEGHSEGCSNPQPEKSKLDPHPNGKKPKPSGDLAPQQVSLQMSAVFPPRRWALHPGRLLMAFGGSN